MILLTFVENETTQIILLWTPLATYFVMAIFFFCFRGTKLWKWRRYSACPWVLCMNCFSNLLLMSLECSRFKIHSGHASLGNRERSVSAGWGGLGVVLGLDENIFFLLSASLRCMCIGGDKFYLFLIGPLSSDVKANYICNILKSWVPSSYIQFWLWPRIFS